MDMIDIQIVSTFPIVDDIKLEKFLKLRPQLHYTGLPLERSDFRIR